MCEWTLRQLGAEQQLVSIRQQFAKGVAVGHRRWYLTKTGGSTVEDTPISLSIVDASQEFRMGSPLSDTDGFVTERQHRRRINRVFAIGMHEITVAQFRRFRPDQEFNRQYSKSDDAPMNLVSWYDAALYCNWLSEQEGIPRDQWCYNPDQEFAHGMQLSPHYLDLSGYRLPTEAEWEYVCRSGTTTSRFFGSSDTLLGDYAWYTKNSRGTGMLPVGSLRPNGSGLFGLCGNAGELCRSVVPGAYPFDREFVPDLENPENSTMTGGGGVEVRGGSFNDDASDTRSSARKSYRPDFREDSVGFRVSRTYSLPP
jgi:hypothetical protein